jgi:hypothetical protein
MTVRLKGYAVDVGTTFANCSPAPSGWSSFKGNEDSTTVHEGSRVVSAQSWSRKQSTNHGCQMLHVQLKHAVDLSAHSTHMYVERRQTLDFRRPALFEYMSAVARCMCVRRKMHLPSVDHAAFPSRAHSQKQIQIGSDVRLRSMPFSTPPD